MFHIERKSESRGGILGVFLELAGLLLGISLRLLLGKSLGAALPALQKPFTFLLFLFNPVWNSLANRDPINNKKSPCRLTQYVHNLLSLWEGQFSPQAWFIMICSFLVNGIVFSIINTFGILFVKVIQHKEIFSGANCYSWKRSWRLRGTKMLLSKHVKQCFFPVLCLLQLSLFQL